MRSGLEYQASGTRLVRRTNHAEFSTPQEKSKARWQHHLGKAPAALLALLCRRIPARNPSRAPSQGRGAGPKTARKAPVNPRTATVWALAGCASTPPFPAPASERLNQPIPLPFPAAGQPPPVTMWNQMHTDGH
jgi:hypothetical protein